MPINNVFWFVVPLLVVVPLLLVLIGRFYHGRGKLGPGIGSAVFIILCWLFALGIVLHRIGTLTW